MALAGQPGTHPHAAVRGLGRVVHREWLGPSLDCGRAGVARKEHDSLGTRRQHWAAWSFPETQNPNVYCGLEALRTLPDGAVLSPAALSRLLRARSYLF